jgi:hypothetical protein
MGEKFERIAFGPILVGQREEIAALGRAGIVDENVESAEFPPRRLNQSLRRGGVAQVERLDRGLAAFPVNRTRSLRRRGPARCRGRSRGSIP